MQKCQHRIPQLYWCTHYLLKVTSRTRVHSEEKLSLNIWFKCAHNGHISPCLQCRLQKYGSTVLKGTGLYEHLLGMVMNPTSSVFLHLKKLNTLFVKFCFVFHKSKYSHHSKTCILNVQQSKLLITFTKKNYLRVKRN